MTFVQEYQGWAAYLSDFYVGPHRLLIAVSCFVGNVPVPVDALLDTAAEWCVLPARMMPVLGFEAVAVPTTRLETRFGVFSGSLERAPVRFPAAEGDSLTIDATWFVSPEWLGPLVLGWKGCLERFRFALDPHAERFYFSN
jgi:hypothetical protein